ncbi:MAG: NADH-quinone oxidoreductase subunit C [Pseudomonadota bacterium]
MSESAINAGASKAHPSDWLPAAITAATDACTVTVTPEREVTVEVPTEHWVSVAKTLRDAPELRFTMLIDLCGVDYLTFGDSEWTTNRATGSGYSRGVQREVVVDESLEFDSERFAVVAHLLSIEHNVRVRLKAFTTNENPPRIGSLIDVWRSADWYEREAFDLFGIVFEGHPDLRRLLTDYGFIGHPFRKDFPLTGNVEVRYDARKGRVAYEPVSIEPRTLVPRVIREDNRYEDALREDHDG